jgi:predicted O-linked N-acetylglucosamine transferase (SPINDLY family)
LDVNVHDGVTIDDLTMEEKASFQLAAEGQLELASLMSLCDSLVSAGKRAAAKAAYRQWLANTTSPVAFVAYFNLGAILSLDGDSEEAEKVNRKALELNPNFIQARLNLGHNLEQLGRTDEMLAEWRKVLTVPQLHNPENLDLHVHVLNSLGRVLEGQRQFKEALEMLEKSLELKPDQMDVQLHRGHLRQKQCIWPTNIVKPLPSKDDAAKGCSPLALLAATNDPELQYAAAKWFLGHKFSVEPREPLAPPHGYRHEKIRIGYLSSDFCMHAVSLLTVELFELHDRERFEVYGFCWSREDGSYLRTRVIEAMDHFVRIEGMNDREAADCIRENEIDILIDLQGLTSGARPLILSYRPAPLQATYLGFPGTTALPWIDYVIADRYLIPEEEAGNFSEQPLYMPNCFQVSDSKRPIGATPTRSENNLPENGFVFCAFNNNYKFSQEMFAVWMRILKQVPGSVLWLLSDNEWSQENLCKAAERLGIKSDRLIFAGRVAPKDYLARYRIADLFLDTFPFNGGTTANDALFMGLPILTLSGRTFASRMAGSLLKNLELEELITTSMAQYEKQAVRLAKNKHLHRALKERLAKNRVSGPVFDIPSFVSHYESALADALTKKVAAPQQASVQPAKMNGAELYIIAYSPASLAQACGGFLPLDNLSNPRPDWMEYWPMRKFLLESVLQDDVFYGFFSPKFTAKTGLSWQGVRDFMAGKEDEADIFTFSPQPDMGAFFLNVFEQNETFDPGFRGIVERLLEEIGVRFDIGDVVMDSRQMVYSNYFVARKQFWLEWLSICERIFDICESNAGDLARDLCALTTYGSGTVQRKVFVIERVASLMLASGKWSIAPYNSFRCGWSATPLGEYRCEAVISDALKMAYNETKVQEYLGAFNTLRARIFVHKQLPMA